MSALPPDCETSRWYEDKVRRHGFDHRGLGFNTRAAQDRRFEALARLGDFHGRRLLDVGCGFGDFLAFLQGHGVQPVYTGLDLCLPMVQRCRERFPARQARFVAADVLDYAPGESFDYVVASGIFGLDAAGARERIAPTLERLFAWCTRAVAVNFLSARSPKPAANRVYVEPAEALALGLRLTPAVQLDHAYLPNDFTLILHKALPWEAEGARA